MGNGSHLVTEFETILSYRDYAWARLSMASGSKNLITASSLILYILSVDLLIYLHALFESAIYYSSFFNTTKIEAINLKGTHRLSLRNMILKV